MGFFDQLLGLGGEGISDSATGIPQRSGVMDVAMPLVLGIAAAAHPALARGASAITQSMAMAGRNRRLKEIMALQGKQEKRAEETHKHQQAMWPSQEAKAQYGGVYETPGGGREIMNYSQGTPQVQVIRPGYGEQWKQGKETEQQIHTQGVVKQKQALWPLEKEQAETLADIQLNKQLEYKRRGNQIDFTKPIGPKDALAELGRLRDDMSRDIKMATAGMDFLKNSQDEINDVIRPIYERYRPHFEFWQGKVGRDVPQFEIPYLPPSGYIPKPGMSDVFFNPKLPPTDPNAYWYPPKKRK